MKRKRHGKKGRSVSLPPGLRARPDGVSGVELTLKRKLLAASSTNGRETCRVSSGAVRLLKSVFAMRGLPDSKNLVG
jgi:hypothetical protein